MSGFKKFFKWLSGENLFSMESSKPISDASSPFTSFMNSLTGAGLTGQQVAQNEYQERLSNTAYQRSVADMQRAGLNPAMMYGSGSAASSPSGASVSSPSLDFQSIISALTLPKQLEQMKASIELQRANAAAQHASKLNTDADTEIKRKQARSMDLDYKFAEDTYDARARGIENAANLSDEQIKNARETRNLLLRQIDTEIQKAASEQERKMLYYWQTQVEKANEHQITALTPLIMEYQKAQTFAQRAAGSASLVHAAHEQKIIDSGQIEKEVQLLSEQVRKTINEADRAAFDSLISEYQHALQTGHISDFMNKVNSMYGHDNYIPDAVFGALNMVTNTIGNVFSGVLK